MTLLRPCLRRPPTTHEPGSAAGPPSLLRLVVIDPRASAGDVKVDGQHLPATVRHDGDAVLHPLAADDPGDGIVRWSTFAVARAHDEVPARARHPRFGRFTAKMAAAEIAGDVLRISRRERAGVPVVRPAFEIFFVTLPARRRAGICVARWERFELGGLGWLR